MIKDRVTPQSRFPAEAGIHFEASQTRLNGSRLSPGSGAQPS
jgi:hypothetical protein